MGSPIVSRFCEIFFLHFPFSLPFHLPCPASRVDASYIPHGCLPLPASCVDVLFLLSGGAIRSS
ncbi:unnamed protein product [Rhodiola kirilowii]